MLNLEEAFERVYVRETQDDSILQRMGEAEDFMFELLLGVHKLPARTAGECSFTASELSGLLSDRQRQSVWQKLTTKYPPDA